MLPRFAFLVCSKIAVRYNCATSIMANGRTRHWANLLVINTFANDSIRGLSVGSTICSEVQLTFHKANGEKIKTTGKIGDTLLDVVVNNNLDLDGFGACEGTLTCSTCHLIFKSSDYNKLPDKPSEEELDMLDMAYELSDTSRLGCQITLTKDMDGLEMTVPATLNDVRNT